MPLYYPPTQDILNAANSTLTAQGGQLNWYGGIGIQLSASTSGASTSISIRQTGFNGSALQVNAGSMTTVYNPALAANSRKILFIPFLGDRNVVCNTIRFWASKGGGSLIGTLSMGLYTVVNSTQLSLQASSSYSYSLSATNQNSGVRIFELTGFSSVTLTEGRYVMAMLWGSVSADHSILYMGNGGFHTNFGGYVFPGVSVTSGTATNSRQLDPWAGAFTATTSGLPGSVAKTQIHGGTPAYSAQVYFSFEEVNV